MSTVIAVSNQKGGVAKTTTALTVAAHFASMGQRVLAVDLDPQANLTLGLGLRGEDAEGITAYEVLASDQALSAAARVTRHEALPQLRVVPANRRLARAERELYGEIGFEDILRERIVDCDADVIILDCPPSLGVLTTNALVAADTVLVPVQTEYFSVVGLASLLDLIRVVRKRRNPELRVKILPTLYDRRNGICRDVLEGLRARFEDELAGVVIEVDTRLREASATGRPINLYAPRSRANRQYESLTRELLIYAKN